MATRAQWIAGTRPRTLPAAVAPVLIGTAIAHYESQINSGVALCAFIVALSLQVGVNFANDYSDGIRGTDEVRVGPVRLVGQKLASAEAVKRAAFSCFATAVISGALMTYLSGLWILIPVGVSAVVAAWFYTGGSRPYGYSGFGEVFVFCYFGLVAVIGTAASQTKNISTLQVIAGISCGLLTCAILIANNLRDIPSDELHGKRTLAVRLGDSRTRTFYQLAMILGIALTGVMTLLPNGPTFAWAALATGFVAIEPIRQVRSGITGPQLIPVLVNTGKTLLAFSIILSFAIWVS